ncbi:hypothetical protein L596_016741 [Steinernema carpocapsae]|uniref:Uncharacterized protein n=1 Tax=Steinernema carpocapsae TaxID=34508 RepID=A0A4U5NK63_STECR|nr:hypothetical protein L596_016741 [Steinernema carpocapsae]
MLFACSRPSVLASLVLTISICFRNRPRWPASRLCPRRSSSSAPLFVRRRYAEEENEANKPGVPTEKRRFNKVDGDAARKVAQQEFEGVCLCVCVQGGSKKGARPDSPGAEPFQADSLGTTGRFRIIR